MIIFVIIISKVIFRVNFNYLILLKTIKLNPTDIKFYV